MIEPTPSRFIGRRTAEIAFALTTMAFGIAILVAARELDTGWSRSGPEAGYFPFRLGLLLITVSLAIGVRELLGADRGAVFMDAAVRRPLLHFALPLVAFIVAIPWIGLYFAAFAYLLLAVGVIGGTAWPRTLAIAIIVPVAVFVLFELIFKSPLPKGPLAQLFNMI